MKNNVIIIILAAISIILSAITFASYDYMCEGSTGQPDCQNLNGTMYITDQAVTSRISPPLSVTGVRYTPLIDDLDSDGHNEIYLFGQNSIRVYEYYNNLTYSGSFTPNNLGAVTSSLIGTSPIIVNLNGTKYVMAAASNSTWASVYFLRFYANKTFTPISNITMKLDYQTVGIYWTGCTNEARCMIGYSPSPVTTTGIRAIAYNIDGRLSDEINLTNPPIGLCISRYARAVSTDVDNDGITHFTTGVTALDDPDVAYYVFDWKLTNNASADPVLNCYGHVDNNVITPISSCSTYFDNKIKAQDMMTQTPLVYDFDSTHDGKEIIIGYQYDSDRFKGAVFDSNCDVIKTYPSVVIGQGQIKSAPFRVNAYDDALDDEFCVMGYSSISDHNFINLLCSTFGDQPSGSPSDLDQNYYGEINLNWNMTDQIKATTYAINQIGNVGEFIGQSQIATPYGLFSIESNTKATNFFDWLLTGIPFLQFIRLNKLNSYYTFTTNNLTIVPYDINNDLHQEIVTVSNNNVEVLVDLYSSVGPRGAVITQIRTIPCFNFSIQNGSLIQVNAIVTNAEASGLASARAVLYADTVNEINTTWATQPIVNGEAPFQWTFTANVTFQNAILRVLANDSFKPDVIVSVDRTFTVADSIDAQVFGESSCTVYNAQVPSTVTGSTTTTTNPNETNVENNLLNRALDKLNELFDNNLGRTVWWLILMIMFAISILFAGLKYGHHIKAVMGILMFSEILLFIIGVFLHVLSVALVIVLVVICLLVIGVWIIEYIS